MRHHEIGSTEHLWRFVAKMPYASLSQTRPADSEYMANKPTLTILVDWRDEKSHPTQHPEAGEHIVLFGKDFKPDVQNWSK